MKDKFIKQKEALYRRLKDLEGYKRDLQKYFNSDDKELKESIETRIKRAEADTKILQKKLGDQFKDIIEQV